MSSSIGRPLPPASAGATAERTVPTRPHRPGRPARTGITRTMSSVPRCETNTVLRPAATAEMSPYVVPPSEIHRASHLPAWYLRSHIAPLVVGTGKLMTPSAVRTAATAEPAASVPEIWRGAVHV